MPFPHCIFVTLYTGTYALVQFAGGILGAFYAVLVHGEVGSSLIAPMPTDMSPVGVLRAIAAEVLVTFFLVTVVLQVPPSLPHTLSRPLSNLPPSLSRPRHYLPAAPPTYLNNSRNTSLIFEPRLRALGKKTITSTASPSA
jgi:hypothetical protein